MFIAERAISLLAPHRCLVCEREGALLCEWCRPDAFPPLPPRCFGCYRLSRDFKTCSDCRKQSRISHAWIVTEYDALATSVIQKFKFQRAKRACELIAGELDQLLPELGSELIITHVPTATGRRRQRGYDQSELIAKSLARLRGLPHGTLLYRHGQARQVGADRQKRIKQMQAVFRVHKNAPQYPKVLLIDDLVTTGASLEAAARTLKNAGAGRVYAAAFAQRSV
ncbi:MAG: hypothetical protein U5L95_02015 [Candidatus Saccharibacteria bacterium]|nr:hypothetical protein [Candidatus Saccharibacteria bacterium]